MKSVHFCKKRDFMCRYNCGKRYKRKDNCGHHERNCQENPNICRGNGVKQQFYDGTVCADSTIKLIKSAHDGHYLLYRMDLNIRKNFHNQLRNEFLKEASNLIKCQKNNEKHIIIASIIYYKNFSESILFTDPEFFFQNHTN